MSNGSLTELLADWLPSQRWFAGGGACIDSIVINSDVQLTASDPELRHLVVDVTVAGETSSYQVLAGLTGDLAPELARGTIGQLADGRTAYDGALDPNLTSVLLRGIVAQRQAGPIRFVAEDGAGIDAEAVGRTLPALQSNTGVVFGNQAILKLLRRPSLGGHPDLEIPATLARAGSELIAAPLGWVELRQPPATSDSTVLAILSEFYPNSTDGWSLATASLHEAHPDFSAEAELLGRATAQLHAELAVAFGTAIMPTSAVDELAGQLASDLAKAIAIVPALAKYESAILTCYANFAASTQELQIQRIHGDYHLGQVLGIDPEARAPSAFPGGRPSGKAERPPGITRWVILDFEGEPLVPLAQRRAFAPAMRDVAGMLRSFDYAARHQLLHDPDNDQLASVAADWVSRSQDAFCSGYGAASGTDPRTSGPLLRALTLSKAVYEAVYETRHRPGWLPIPLQAIAAAVADIDRGGAQMNKPTNAPVPMKQPGEMPPDPVTTDEIETLLAGLHHDPHAILGAHRGPDGTVVRALRPLARSVSLVLDDGSKVPMRHLHQGVFSATVESGLTEDYRLAVDYSGGPELVADDPYRHLPTLGEMDLHLISEGRHEELWRALGARVFPELGGTSFSVWAPNARGVRVIGDFNHWDGRAHPMRSLGGSGVWELFVPGLVSGEKYKFEICAPDGSWHRKADPMATYAEVPPATASVVFESRYEWADQDWMTTRAQVDPLRQPMSIYEVHLGSWRPGLSYRKLADELVTYVKDRGFTHVEFMPVAEHPFGGSWGYQVTSYYAPTARFGTPDDFRFLVDRLHQAGIGVFVDWVPAHFPRDSWALARFDGTSLYEHPDPHRGEHPDWGTLIFDFGRREVRNFLVANALYWLEEFHIDGLRVDAVASMLYLDYSRKDGEWTPNVLGGRENLDAVSFLQEVNATAYKRSRGIVMIAEESTAWPGVTRPVHLGGLGFGLKWNLGWMHDTLAYLAHDPLFRRYHHNELTFSMMYAYSENFVLPLSHDEVVHGKGSLLGKMTGDDWKKFASLRALFAYMWAHPGKQLLFMGSEFGQRSEWSQENGLDWAALAGPREAGLRRLIDDLNTTYRRHPALWRHDYEPAGFSWIDANDAMGNVISFLRFDEDGPPLACVVNFSGEPHYDYRIGLPKTGLWREALNTDVTAYGGSGVGNLGSVQASADPWHGRPASAVLTVPPLSTLWLVHDKSHDQTPPEPASVSTKDKAQDGTGGSNTNG